MTPLPIRHILFPYDFSEQGRQIVPYVGAFSRCFGSKLTVFSVAPPGKIEEAVGEDFADVPTQWITTCGDPALRIADFAHNRDVDLVMMPTHGMGLFRRVLAGSVTSKVLHDVRCPVWTAAHAERQCAPHIPKTILCAVDANSEGVPLLQYAALFSKRVQAALHVLHVAGAADVRETAADAVEAMLSTAGVRAESAVVNGCFESSAVDAARADHADLLIVGRGALCHTFGIVERSPCPVLSV